MAEWRLVIDNGRSVYWNMAIDEALLLLRENSEIPNTLRLYYFKPSSITIGYFQRVVDAVNLEYVQKTGIPFTRRVTGGGSVYHDEKGEITYSVVASLEDFPSDIIERYRAICMGLVYAIEYLGLKAEFKPINDVVVNGKKVSGSAQTRKKHAFLQHGTLMYNTDLSIVAKALKAPREKLRDHGVKSIRERVTTLSIELKHSIGRDEVLEALIRGFEKALNTHFYIEELSRKELELAEKLVDKYSSRGWIYRR
ncbi:MAG: biotin/lipoate A/B protein ligase family protein [Thermoprotei archaeon]